MFLLPFINPKTYQPIEESIGFILHRVDGTQSYILVSDYLATAEPKARYQIKEMLTRKSKTSELTVFSSEDISKDVDICRIK